MAGVKRKACTKDWEEILCPICMDHPHNAVILRCTSHENGCRSYICDTSYRHSNCLDRFKELKTRSISSEINSEPSDSNLTNLNLNCPMCRGSVLSWEIAKEARKHLNLMSRACSQESCSFFGTYQELRVHARSAHPTARPTHIDPSRKQAWARLEHQTEFNDVVSAVRSAMPGAVVYGDYAIESGEREGSSNGPLWSTFFLFQMVGSVDAVGDQELRARAWARHRARDLARPRQFLWGENLLGLQDEDNDDDDVDDDNDDVDDEEDLHILSDLGEDAAQIPRRRRRLTRSQSDADQSRVIP